MAVGHSSSVLVGEEWLLTTVWAARGINIGRDRAEFGRAARGPEHRVHCGEVLHGARTRETKETACR